MIRRRIAEIGTCIVCLAALGELSSAQVAQVGMDDQEAASNKLRVEYVGYRAARYETEALIEPDNERPNRGGLVYVYLTNVCDEPVRLAFYQVNGKDESTWRLDGLLAWDRLYHETVAPGQTTVLELNGITEDFAPGRPFVLNYIDRSWRPAMTPYETTLTEDSVQIASVRILPDLQSLDVHVRHTGDGKATLSSLEILRHETTSLEWVGAEMGGPSHAIARLTVSPPLTKSELAILKLGVAEQDNERYVYTHRRAFPDYFPIGTWSANEGTWEVLRRIHIDTIVEGGNAENPFFTQAVPKYGFRAMAGNDKGRAVDSMRSLGNLPSVACWMLTDEPDWSTPANIILWADDLTRRFNTTIPTFVTLCRNVKFFEYAAIADIPCHDHYCVTAPTSSKWPHRYGTRLEETGYYTRDLKAACEPKPTWVWSQAIASWDERPLRPVPTPDELAAQLLYNLGRGAKGILWFNYEHDVAEKYPDVRDAMREWGRVLRMIREDVLASDPVDLRPEAPEKVDVATLVTRDKILVFVSNQDYDIDPEAYPFHAKTGVKISLRLPDWIAPEAALDVSPAGITPLDLTASKGKVDLDIGDLRVARLIVLANDPDTGKAHRAEYRQALADETRTY